MQTPTFAPLQGTDGGVPKSLYGLFFLSGVSGMMYEVVWVRMLGRTLGNTVYATATVLAAFMAGLAVGSFCVRNYLPLTRRLLLLYGLLELGIGLAAVTSLALPEGLLPVYRLVYWLAGGSRASLTAGQAGLAFALLLAPTALMGATLPTLAAFASGRQDGFGRSLGTLYALNTFGAAVGVLASGFVLLGVVGESWTAWIGAGLNVTAALGALWLQRTEKEGATPATRDLLPAELGPDVDDIRIVLVPRDTTEGTENGLGVSPKDPSAPGRISPYSPGIRLLVLGCFAASGFTAVANEVVWARMLTLYQGTSIYSFSALLAVLLAGIALGSWWGGRLADRWRDPLRALAYLQLATGLAGLAALHLYGMGQTAQPDLARGENLATLLWAPLVLVGPAGVLGGLMFPTAARCYTPSREAAGRRIAELYAGNTVGCIAGSLAGGFLLLPLLGASESVLLLAGIGLFSGMLLLFARLESSGRMDRLVRWSLPVACGLLLLTADDAYYRLLRRQMERVYPGRVVVYRHIEEAAATTTAFGASPSATGRERQLWVDGYGMTGLDPATKLMAHLPLWLAEDPREALVVCFGMGTTVRSACRHEGIEVWAVELVPGVYECFDFFHADASALRQRPEMHLVVDDGRNYLLMHDRRYDVITIDPPPPLYSAGTVNLYSREFFRLCADRLRPGGVCCLWVPAWNQPEVKAVMRTFLAVFPCVRAWEGPAPDRGLYLLGTGRPIRDIPSKIRRGYNNAEIAKDLAEWGNQCDDPAKVLALCLGDERQLGEFVAETPVITDDRPYTEFPLWRALFDLDGYHTQLSGPLLRQSLGSPRTSDMLPARERLP